MVLERLSMGAWEVSWEAFGGLLEPWQGSLGPLGGSWDVLGSILELKSDLESISEATCMHFEKPSKTR